MALLQYTLFSMTQRLTNIKAFMRTNLNKIYYATNFVKFIEFIKVF